MQFSRIVCYFVSVQAQSSFPLKSINTEIAQDYGYKQHLKKNKEVSTRQQFDRRRVLMTFSEPEFKPFNLGKK